LPERKVARVHQIEAAEGIGQDADRHHAGVGR
jgi:hypothetical protein